MEENQNPFKKEKLNAPFNMAVDTLQRCGEILRDIKNLSATPYLDIFSKQIEKINLVKQFFANCSPLLSEKTVKKYMFILAIEPSNKREVNIKNQIQYLKPSFNFKLDTKLDTILVNLQRELQKEGNYLMPSRKDPKYSWGQGE